MRRTWLNRGLFLVSTVGVACSAVLLACGDDDSGTTTKTDAGHDTGTTTDAPSETTGTIAGNATYSGAKTGPLIVVVFKDQPQPGKPPSSPPVGLGSNESPTWPGTNPYSVKNVAPGSYFVAGYIMVGPEHRMGAQPGDPVAIPATPVTVTAGQTATADITLRDLPQGDGGADGGDAGDASDDG